MSHHNYREEPNVRFSPDKTLVIFTSNMFGPSYVFGAEVAKADNPPAEDVQSTPELARRFNPVDPPGGRGLGRRNARVESMGAVSSQGIPEAKVRAGSSAAPVREILCRPRLAQKLHPHSESGMVFCGWDLVALGSGDFPMTLRPRASLLLVLFGLPLALSLAACNKVQALSIVPGPGIEVLTAAGQTAQYTAYAQEQMGSGPMTTANVTNSVTWSTSNPNIATINSSGLATAVGAGYVEITAVASDGAIASSDLTVDSEGSTTQSIPSITILPGTAAETFIGETTQFTATGNLTGIGNAQNVTTQVTWLSSNAQVATINSSGLATAAGAGTTMIVAESGGLNSSATVTVAISSTGTGTPSITVTPNSASDTFAGETTQFIASGNLTGVGGPLNLTNTVTWLSSNAQVATINSAGLATAVGAGTTTITAESGGLNATVSLTVSVPASGSGSGTPTLAVVPSSVAETFSGETTQFTATGNLTGIGAIQNLTNQVTLGVEQCAGGHHQCGWIGHGSGLRNDHDHR